MVWDILSSPRLLLGWGGLASVACMGAEGGVSGHRQGVPLEPSPLCWKGGLAAGGGIHLGE